MIKWLCTYRSSRPEVFCKNGVLRNFTKVTGKHLCQSLFFNKVAGRWLLLYIKERTNYREWVCIKKSLVETVACLYQCPILDNHSPHIFIKNWLKLLKEKNTRNVTLIWKNWSTKLALGQRKEWRYFTLHHTSNNTCLILQDVCSVILSRHDFAFMPTC